MATIVTEDYVLPAHWASALVNDDYSGCTDSEEDEIRSWCENHPGRYCVGCSDEAEFRWRNDANGLGGDCLTFTFQLC